MKTINHPWKNKVVSLEKKLDKVNFELYDANMDLECAREVIVNKKQEYQALESRYGLAKSWAKWASATALVLGLTTAYLAVKTEAVVKDTSKVQSVADTTNQPQYTFVKGKSASPTFWYVYASSELHGERKYYPIFQDDNALDMHGYLKVDPKIMEMTKGSGNLTEQSFLIPADIIQKDGSFTVWAVDRNGNESSRKTLYAFKGYISEKPIPR